MVKNRELIEEEIYDEEEEQKKLKLISSPPVRKTGLFARRLWTISEKTAVYKGVQKHGAGHIGSRSRKTRRSRENWRFEPQCRSR